MARKKGKQLKKEEGSEEKKKSTPKAKPAKSAKANEAAKSPKGTYKKGVGFVPATSTSKKKVQPPKKKQYSPRISFLRGHENSMPDIRITPEAYKDIACIIESAPGNNEIGWLGTVEKRSDNIYVIDEIFLPEQTVGGASEDSTKSQISTVAYNMLTSGDPDGLDKANRIRFWGHLHPGNSTHPSGRDEDQMEIDLAECDYFIRGIFGHYGAAEFTFYNYDKGTKWSDVPWNIDLEIESEREERIKKEIAEKVKTYSYSAPTTLIRDGISVVKRIFTGYESEDDQSDGRSVVGKEVITNRGDGLPVPLREDTNASGKLIDEIPDGTNLTVEEEKNSYYKVSYKGQTGWIYNQWTSDFEADDNQSVDEESVVGKEVIVDVASHIDSHRSTLSLREAPGSDSKEIDEIPHGTGGLIVEEEKSFYYKVCYNEQTGWIYGGWTKLAENSEEDDNPTILRRVRITSASGTYLWDEPGGSTVDIVPPGTELDAFEEKNRYLRVFYKGQEGWIADTWAGEVNKEEAPSQETSEETPESETADSSQADTALFSVTVVQGGVVLLEKPEAMASIVNLNDLVSAGEVLAVYEEKDGWYFVLRKSGIKGWIVKGACAPLH